MKKSDFIILLEKEDDEGHEQIVEQGVIKNEIEGIGVLIALSIKAPQRSLKLLRVIDEHSTDFILKSKASKVETGGFLKCKPHRMG